MATDQKSKILIFGSTGYLGKYLTKASISMGYPTYAYVRPFKPHMDPSKIQILNPWESIFTKYGELDEHEKLVRVTKEVDIVISALAVPQYLDQIKIISAMKEAGNVKRFIPSEFGNEVERVNEALPPFQKILDNKKKIRRATEKAGIPFTYISANSLAAYFVNYLLHPHHNSNEVTLYGTGQAKAIFNYEEDVAVYTLKAATDPRATNRVIICRPPENIISQLDLVTSWEKKTGRTMKKSHVSEHEIIRLSQNLPSPDNIPVAIIHSIFVLGAQVSFELTNDDLEASTLYPEHDYTSVGDLLNRYLVDPPMPKLATFA